MNKPDITIKQFNIVNNQIDITVAFKFKSPVDFPRVAIVFNSSTHNRRLPMAIDNDGTTATAHGTYDMGYIFYKYVPKNINISFVVSDGVDVGCKIDTDLVCNNIKTPNKFKHFINASKKEKAKILVGNLLNFISLPYRCLKIKDNRVTFLSNRTAVPTGNLRAVYDAVSKTDGLDVKLICASGGAKGTAKTLLKFIKLYMTSRVVYVDDYYHPISYITKKPQTKLVQLWHGCGAFKTFGFSRYHKDSTLELGSPNHRQYDYAVVSSPSVKGFYAEAFGIDEQNVVSLGSPRCDYLVDDNYKTKFKNKFYNTHSNLKDKKILLFAPTFRGKGNGDCYYPCEVFDIDKVLDILGDEWAVIVKLHPYCTEKYTCSNKYKDRLVDCFEYDVNDILLVTDFLVTDYSSVIFEASILDIPMAFLTFDLTEFIAKRDFYFDFAKFVPGPMAKTDVEIAQIVKNNGADMQAVRTFKQTAFGDTLGTACNNLKQFTSDIINNK